MLSRVYDPLGHANPFILKARKIVHELFRRKVGWDDQIPDDISRQWDEWLQQLPSMTAVKIPRHLKPPTFKHKVSAELHHFCDVSEVSYGVVSYIRCECRDEFSSAIVMAKCRLSPLKVTTIPRLELVAATLAVKQDSYLSKEMELPLIESHYWTDSSIVIGYINNEDKRFETFVANRIATIRNGSNPCQWRHVDTELNPADHLTRGLSPEDLKQKSWLEGRKFPNENRQAWPEGKLQYYLEDTDLEVKGPSAVVHATTASKEEEHIIAMLLKRYSSWTKPTRAIAWILAVKKVLTKKKRPNQSHHSMQMTSEKRTLL